MGYQAYRGYRRHDSRTMRALSAGLFFLTTVAFGVASVVGLVGVGYFLAFGREFEAYA